MAISGDIAPHITGTVIVLVVIGYITFALRVYTRVTRSVWGREDWVMTFALVRRTLLRSSTNMIMITVCSLLDRFHSRRCLLLASGLRSTALASTRIGSKKKRIGDMSPSACL